MPEFWMAADAGLLSGVRVSSCGWALFGRMVSIKLRTLMRGCKPSEHETRIRCRTGATSPWCDERLASDTLYMDGVP